MGGAGRHIIAHLAEQNVPVAHITTNGLGLDREVSAALISGGCDQIRISLNVADRDDYSRMMGVGPACFDRVAENIRRLVAMKKGHPQTTIIVQFLTDRHNYRSVPEMYRFGRSLGVDKMLFNGLSYVDPADRMDEAEVAALIEFYRQILEEDEYRFVIGVHSYELDLADQLHTIEARIGARRNARSRFQRLTDYVARQESPRTTIAHRKWMKARSGSRTMSALHGEPCLLPWYSMIIRADGSVPPCCALQHSSVATVEERDLTSIWHGAGMTALRRQLRAAALGHQYESMAEHPADQICAVGTGSEFQCPFKATFYRHDLPFSRRLAGVVEDTRTHAVALRSDASVVGPQSENHNNDRVPGLS